MKGLTSVPALLLPAWRRPKWKGISRADRICARTRISRRSLNPLVSKERPSMASLRTIKKPDIGSFTRIALR